MTEALWLRFRGGQADAIKRAIEQKGEFTTTVARSDVKPKDFQICIVSLEDLYDSRVEADFFIDYGGVSRSGSLVATDEKRIKVGSLIEAGRIDVRTLASELPTRHRNQLPNGFGAPMRIPPKMTESIIAAIQRRSESIASGMARIRAHLAELRQLSAKTDGDISALERDAVVTSLETFGGTSFRKEILRATQPATNATSTFLSRLPDYEIREDTQINFDAIAFPGFTLAKKHVVGAIEVVNTMGQRLTIMNCNRQKLEQTLGVDLIYFSHNYRSFVLVQYKRLVPNAGGKPAYWPDSDPNYAVEIEKMNCAAEELTLLNSKPTSVHDYRLGSDAFYFKFCEARQKSSLDAGMISGMYLPLGLWNQFVLSEKSKGPRGGLRIDWDRHPRSLNNSSFCHLLKNGWVGSSAAQTKCLEQIIEGTLAGKRMLVIAATSPNQSRPDQLRDDLGRYTDGDDPLGVC